MEHLANSIDFLVEKSSIVKLERSLLEAKFEALQIRLDNLRPRLTRLLRNDYVNECIRLEASIDLCSRQNRATEE